MSTAAPTLTLYHQDQLERLEAILRDYPRMEGRYAVAHQKGIRDDDVPAVWRELRALGLVTITFADCVAYVSPVTRERDE